MSDLRIESPRLTTEFVEHLAGVGIKMPVRPCEETVGVILDAEGKAFLTVDYERDMEDEHVVQIVVSIVIAMNTCGGFRAVWS